MRYSAVLFVFLLAGCETVSEYLPEFETAEPAAATTTTQPKASQAETGDLRPVRSGKELSAFEIDKRMYAEEDKDLGTPHVSGLINPAYRGPTPTTLAGGKLISTYDLLALINGKNKSSPVLINALPGSSTELIDGSVWLSGAGAGGRFNDETQTRIAENLKTLTDGDNKKLLVFYCLDLDCWYSYNAALRASVADYRNIMWYRGGLKAWYEAGLPSKMSSEDNW